MAGGAVFFVITIPTAVEEQRLKDEFITRKLVTKQEKTSSISTTPTNGIPFENKTQLLDARDTLSLQTLKLDSDSLEVEPQYGTFSKRRKSVPETELNNRNVHAAVPAVTTTNRKKSLDGLRFAINTAKSKMTTRMHNNNDMDLAIDTAMEVVLREILKKFQITNAIWCKDATNVMYKVTFTIEFNEMYENLYEKLHEWGIGDREGSTVSVMNCIASKTYASREDLDDLDDDAAKDNVNAQKQGAWDRFMNSVRARLNVAQIVRDLRQDAAITFDFIVLLVSAAVLAAFGLIEDSTIFLASSMLISPLMGPIIAAIFGTVIKEPTLRTVGMKNELIGILLATLVGFVFGLFICITDQRYGNGEGLTEEMLSRCDLHSLIVGVFTAIPSGAAAAIGILGGNIGSLVGVAISASLLPPAVNSGLLWALACIYKIFENDDTRYSYVVKSNRYSDNQATELAILGTISMCLTISNVICVFIMGIIVLKVKEIAPVIAKNNSRFWKYDIKLARDMKKNGGVADNDGIMNQFVNLAKEDQQVLGINYEFLRKLDEATYQHTWSPLSNRLGPPTEADNYSTIHRLEQLYTTISSPQSVRDNRRLNNIIRRPSERAYERNYAFRQLLENRPRFATMPSNQNIPKQNVPEIVIDLCAPERDSTETISKRFTVTPAAEDPLLKP